MTFFGLSLEHMLEEAGSEKPGKAERRAKAAREALLKKVMGPEEEQTSGFADPAAMFT